MAGDVKAKYRRIYEEVHDAIITGRYGLGQQIPTEAELAAQYGASRPTVARALRDLEHRGYLVRRQGVGSFVGEGQRSASRLLGLILPRPGLGIFAGMCDAIVRESEAAGHGVLLAGNLMAGRDVALPREEAFCEQMIARKVAGVFFGPLDVHSSQMTLNEQIAERLEKARIPLVLLDRDIYDYPRRSGYDLVGIDNRREGAGITEHLLALGCRRIEFLTHDWPVSTASARIEGYKDALARYGVGWEPGWVHAWDADDRQFVRNLMRSPHAEAFVCVNDAMAASRLPVPLTTVRQPAGHLGAVAVRMLLERLANPGLPARQTMLSCELVVRESCGGRMPLTAAAAG